MEKVMEETLTEVSEEQYPQYKIEDSGIKVLVNKRTALPGIFLTFLDAERAYIKYTNKPKTFKRQVANKKVT
jgi:hypothetical protein